MIGTPRRRLMAVAATVAGASLALATLPAEASVVSKETGVSSSEIVLGTTVPMTGIASPGYNKVAPAMQAYFDYVNDKGGIYGRKIRLVIKDDGYIPAKTKALTNELILKDKIFAMVGALGTGTHKTVIADLKRRGIPDLFPNTGFTGFNDPAKYPTTFTFLPSYQVEAKILGDYINKTYPGKKVGVLVQADDFGRDALAGFDSAGVKFASVQKYASGAQAAGLGTQMTALEAAGCDVVVLFGVSSASAVALNTAARSGYLAKATWLMTSVASDVPAALRRGVTSTSFAPSFSDENNAWVKFFKDVNAQYNKGKDTTFDNNVMIGLSVAFLVTQAISAAGKNLTRKGLIAALESQGSKFANPTMVPLNYSKSNHSGPAGYWIGKYDANGNLQPLSGSYAVSTTSPGSSPIVASSYKQAPLPANGLPAKR